MVFKEIKNTKPILIILCISILAFAFFFLKNPKSLVPGEVSPQEKSPYIILKSSSNLVTLKENKVQVDLSITSNFSNPIYKVIVLKERTPFQEMKTPEKQISLEFKEIGDYQIFAKALDEKGKNLGQSNELEIKIIPFQKLPPPVFHNPFLEIELDTSIDSSLRNPSFFDFILPSAFAADSQSTFSWEPIKGASSYRVDISVSPDFKKELQTIAVSETFILWKPSRPATYYFRVRGVDDLGNEGEPSKVAKLIVHPKFDATAVPELKTNIGSIENDKVKLDLLWGKIKGARSYEIFLEERNLQEEVITRTHHRLWTNSFSETLPISDRRAKIYLRIRAISPLGKKTNYSKWELVNLSKLDDVPEINRVSKSRDLSIQDLFSRTGSFYFSYERFQLGRDWDKMATKLNTTSSQASMDVFSAGYLFPKSGFDTGGGVDVLYIKQGSISLVFPVLDLKVIKNIYFSKESSWSFRPNVSAFFTPLPIKGIYGGKINLPFSYDLSKRVSIYAGLAYVIGKIFGQKKILGKVDPNLHVGGASALIGLQLYLD